MSRVIPGRLLAVLNEEEDLFHEWFVLARPALHVAGLEYCRILTPDGDVHDEEMSGADVGSV